MLRTYTVADSRGNCYSIEYDWDPEALTDVTDVVLDAHPAGAGFRDLVIFDDAGQVLTVITDGSPDVCWPRRVPSPVPVG